MPWAEHFLSQYGYFAIFGLLMLGIVGPLIPDETILVVAGILIRRGTLAWPGALSAAIAGSLCGITLSYTVGRAGLAMVMRLVSPKYLDLVHDYFARYGPWTLFFGYFIVGVRHFTALVAGLSKIRFRRFALYAYSGGCFWATAFLALGYFIGDQWERWARYLHAGFLTAAAGVVIAVLVWTRVHRSE